ncbi:hypothetical protein [Glutamicibacter sp.]|uniref:hypothetical protein n=1 Tax=Glutamicibacter sp. TaxID=1931995 RepID=UPI002FE3CD3D
MAYSVLPIVDRQTGQVQFKFQGQWLIRYVDDPGQLEHLLARCARRPLFNPDSSELVLGVATAGQSQGRSIAFSLAKFPSLRPLTKLGS